MNGRRLAVVISVEQHDDSVLRRFSVPSADVPALAEVLGDPALGGFETAHLRDPGTREAQDRVTSLFEGRDQEDCVLVYFRGVMLTGPGGGLYLAAADTVLARPAETAVDVAQIAALMQRSRAGQAVVLLDGRTGGPVDAGHHFRAARSTEWQSRVVIAATPRLEPPTLAGLIAEGLSGGGADRNRDGWIGVSELYDHLRERDPSVRQWVFGSGRQPWLARVRRPGSDQMAQIAQLAVAAAGTDLSRAVEARETLRRLATGEGLVAAAAAAALRRTSIRVAEPSLDFGRAAPGTRQLTAEIAVQGPPLGAASVVSSTADGLYARLDGGLLRVSWFPAVGRLDAVVTLDGPAGAARLTVTGEVSEDLDVTAAGWVPAGGGGPAGTLPPGSPAVPPPGSPAAMPGSPVGVSPGQPAGGAVGWGAAWALPSSDVAWPGESSRPGETDSPAGPDWPGSSLWPGETPAPPVAAGGPTAAPAPSSGPPGVSPDSVPPSPAPATGPSSPTVISRGVSPWAPISGPPAAGFWAQIPAGPPTAGQDSTPDAPAVAPGPEPAGIVTGCAPPGPASHDGDTTDEPVPQNGSPVTESPEPEAAVTGGVGLGTGLEDSADAEAPADIPETGRTVALSEVRTGASGAPLPSAGEEPPGSGVAAAGETRRDGVAVPAPRRPADDTAPWLREPDGADVKTAGTGPVGSLRADPMEAETAVVPGPVPWGPDRPGPVAPTAGRGSWPVAADSGWPTSPAAPWPGAGAWAAAAPVAPVAPGSGATYPGPPTAGPSDTGFPAGPAGTESARAGHPIGSSGGPAPAGRPPRTGYPAGYQGGFSAGPGATGYGSAGTGYPPGAGDPPYPGKKKPRRRAVLIAAGVVLLALVSGGSYLGVWLARSGDRTVAAPQRTVPPGQTPQTETRPGGAVSVPATDQAGTLAPAPPSLAKPVVVDRISVGQEPEGVTVAPDGKTIYVADQSSRDVHVVDVASKKVNVVKVPNTPRFLTLSADGARLYVSLFENDVTGNGLAVIDTATRSLVKTIRTGPRPFEPAVAPDGKVWVPIHNGGRVEIYDPRSLTEAARISVPPNPHWIAFVPDGRTAFTANHESSQISVVNVADGLVRKNFKVGRSPHALAVTPDGSQLVVTNYDLDTVEVYDTGDQRLIHKIKVGREPQAVMISADGKHAYIVNEGSDSLSVIALGAGRVVSTVAVGDSPRVNAISPDGRRLYVTDGRGKTVTVLRTTQE